MRNNTHLASAKGITLIVWNLLAVLKNVWRVSSGCLSVSGWCVDVVWRMSEAKSGLVKSALFKSALDKSMVVKSALVKSRLVMSELVKSGQVKSKQVQIGQDKSSQGNLDHVKSSWDRSNQIGKG